jgi:hypothetical protein
VVGILHRSREDVAIGVPSRTYDVAFARVTRFLLWPRVRVVRRRFVVAGLPLRELLIQHAKLRLVEAAFDHVRDAERCVVILGTIDALKLTDELATAIWAWWHEANCLARPDEPGSAKNAGPSPVIDLVFQLERWPFNFPTERVMRMTAAEAVARLEEFARASADAAARAAVVA